MAAKAKASITISHLIDILSVTRYYLLQSSTSAVPAKPTTNPPSGWTVTEPSYTSGSTNTLYFVDCTVFTNGTFKYSEVSKSSSYEAAKEAYNKAVAVETRVISAETQIEQNTEAITLRATKTEVTNVKTDADSTAKEVYDVVTRVTKAESTIQTLADNIVTLVTDADGSSYMTQTSSGWTFSTSAIQKSVGDITDGLADLETEFGNTNDAVDSLKGRLGNLEDYVYVGEYTYTDSEGVEQTDMCIELGGRDFVDGESKSDFKLRITKNRIEFFEGSNIPAYISNNALNIEKAIIKGELVMGDVGKETLSGIFSWKVRDNGHLGLSWIEKTEVTE